MLVSIEVNFETPSPRFEAMKMVTFIRGDVIPFVIDVSPFIVDMSGVLLLMKSKGNL